MKLLVPLTIPWMRSIGVAESDSSSTLTTGTAPPTAASKRILTSRARAVSKSSSPYCESSCLFAVTTCLPAFIARSRCSRAGSMPPITPRRATRRNPPRGPGHAVVVVRHREAVGAGRGRHDHVPGPRLVEQRAAHDHIARLAVLARQDTLGGAAEAIDDMSFIGSV